MGAIKFIKLFLHFWKVVTVKGRNADVGFNDPLRAVVTSDSDNRF